MVINEGLMVFEDNLMALERNSMAIIERLMTFIRILMAIIRRLMAFNRELMVSNRVLMRFKGKLIANMGDSMLIMLNLTSISVICKYLVELKIHHLRRWIFNLLSKTFSLNPLIIFNSYLDT